jgi:hypothetical protein
MPVMAPDAQPNRLRRTNHQPLHRRARLHAQLGLDDLRLEARGREQLCDVGPASAPSLASQSRSRFSPSALIIPPAGGFADLLGDSTQPRADKL